jgi:hypothetical protein
VVNGATAVQRVVTGWIEARWQENLSMIQSNVRVFDVSRVAAISVESSRVLTRYSSG